MLDVKELKGEMARHGYTQARLASELGITARTFSNRLKSGDFGCKEIEVMMELFHLNDPTRIFFASKVT